MGLGPSGSARVTGAAIRAGRRSSPGRDAGGRIAAVEVEPRPALVRPALRGLRRSHEGREAEAAEARVRPRLEQGFEPGRVRAGLDCGERGAHRVVVEEVAHAEIDEGYRELLGAPDAGAERQVVRGRRRVLAHVVEQVQRELGVEGRGYPPPAWIRAGPCRSPRHSTAPARPSRSPSGAGNTRSCPRPRPGARRGTACA